MDGYCIASMVLRSITALIATIIAIYMVYQGIQQFCLSNTNKKTKRMNNFLKYSYWIYTFAICGIAIVNYVFRCLVAPETRYVADMITAVFYLVFILPCLLMIFAFRLYITFKESAYALTNNQIILICIAMFITFGCFDIAVISLPLMLYLPYTIHSPFAYAFLTGFALYLVLSIGIMSIFIHKLTALVLAQTQSMRGDMIGIGNNNNMNIEVTQNQKKWIRVITKYLTVSLVALCTTIMAFGMQIVAFTYDDAIKGFGAFRYPMIELIYVPLFQIEYMTNAVCFYLTFTFAEKEYYRLCGLLDGCIYKIFVRETTQHIRRSIHMNSVPVSLIK